MTHALAEVVHAYLSTACVHGEHRQCRETCKFCPAGCRCGCHGPLLHDTAPLLHDTDAEASTTGRHAAGALIPEPEPAYDESMPLRVCEATGNTVRGPVYPVEKPGEARKFYCRICFAAYRRSISHLDDPLPLEDAP